MKNLGLVYALSAYFIWGVVPIFWKWLEEVPALEIVAHRMVWSCLLVVLLILISREWREFTKLFRQRQLLSRLCIASILVSVNWAIFICAVNTGHIVEASMGYFINPLINVLFGVLFFHERLRVVQWTAIFIAGVGVAYLVVMHGEIPWIALSLALTFSSYGAVKKSLQVSATHGMAIETGFLVVPALVFLLYLGAQNQGAFGPNMEINGLLILGGLVTLVPLVLFAAAAKQITMTALGMSQYLGPTLQLSIGVLLFHEPFGVERQISFGLIWFALFLYTLDQVNHRRRRRQPVAL